MALAALNRKGVLEAFPITDFLAAVSVGMVEGHPLLDLCYHEDSAAQVDMNVVMTGGGQFVEVQGTGEESTFTRQQLDAMLSLAEAGINQLQAVQKETLGAIAHLVGRGRS
jgi:ribonuclease PH